jgi:DNA-binding transcriptional LysR family regulator
VNDCALATWRRQGRNIPNCVTCIRKLKLYKLLDLTTGEQIMGLRRGEIDLALTYLGRELLSRDFYTRKLATVRSLAALPIKHRLASQIQISISQLKNEHFLQVSDLGAPTGKKGSLRLLSLSAARRVLRTLTFP